MPCEGCHAQFTVFKRKRSCYDCKRYYCQNCLVNGNSNSNNNNNVRQALCERCLIFSKRPLVRSDLVKLKPKDLIFFLQSKHISTAGCVEKEELIDLVIQYVNRADINNQTFSGVSGSSSDSSGPHPEPKHQSDGVNTGDGERRSSDYGQSANNSFDSIKQTCQKFFNSISDNISGSLANLESRACSKSRPTSSPTQMTSAATGITEQPRITTRVMPTYASNQQISPENPITSPDEERRPNAGRINIRETLVVNLPPSEENHENRGNVILNMDDHNTTSIFNSNGDPSTSTSTSKAPSQYSKLTIYISNEEESSHSSFEELGAIGGISDDSKTTTDTTSSTTDNWQMLDLKTNDSEAITEVRSCTIFNNSSHNKDKNKNRMQNNKKLTRRRSDSYLNSRKPQTSVDGEEDDANSSHHHPQNVLNDEIQSHSASIAEKSTTNQSCTRCGKNKAYIRQQVEKMRQHLESSQMSEADIKHELTEFLSYLEQRTKSIEYSDSEAGVSSATASKHTNEIGEQDNTNIERHIHDEIDREDMSNSSTTCADQSELTTTHIYDKDSRFINLFEIESDKQLECLAVKQLKELLILHRVDYKGCCEKQELLDRVKRLWKNLKSTPDVEKLPTNELCKICMDAPIECVILECGHMATCTNCGKVLSECPICRQYIVRVVRFFRA